MRHNDSVMTVFLCSLLFGSLALQAIQCRPQLSDGAKDDRRSIDDTINNSTSSLDDEGKSEKLMVCLPSTCKDFDPNGGTCYCCPIMASPKPCYDMYHDCQANCHPRR
ncbi:hypothetical protein BS78_K215500 [Paspalum vaginatum]|uniref:Embryo surrounding factor 1 brassicaceae domain-containing protein n=1 Tax=Paspalum vaginatum TaxID=158149 RepID=A0A9W7X8U4_9POAL|nr:hypothetical protein BS78_K215500 [Paspalum vaginatum]